MIRCFWVLHVSSINISCMPLEIAFQCIHININWVGYLPHSVTYLITKKKNWNVSWVFIQSATIPPSHYLKLIQWACNQSNTSIQNGEPHDFYIHIISVDCKSAVYRYRENSTSSSLIFSSTHTYLGSRWIPPYVCNSIGLSPRRQERRC